MDHSTMDHSMMDHSAHGSMGDRCSMSMLFTWNTDNLCIVFEWWHIRTTTGLIFSLLAVVALTALYEAVRSTSRTYEQWAEKRANAVPIPYTDDGAVTEGTPVWLAGQNRPQVTQQARIIKAALYAFQSFYAFMLMLLFMTYNGWVMISMAIGAFIGYLLFGSNIPATKDGSCH